MDKFLSGIVGLLSGEFLLKGRANGGTVILLRTVFVSAWIYLLALALHSYSAKGAMLSFSPTQFSEDLHETLPWLGAILAGVYAALYARFSAQWDYLASLY